MCVHMCVFCGWLELIIGYLTKIGRVVECHPWKVSRNVWVRFSKCDGHLLN